MRRLILASALLALLSTDRAEAQLFNNPAKTYGVGPTTGPGPRFSGFGIGILPHNYRGAPGESQGTFTPPDHRMFNVAPNFGMGLGWFGKRSPSPRPDPNFQFNPPVMNTTEEPPLYAEPEIKTAPAPEIKLPPIPEINPAATPEATPNAKGTIIVEVRLPAANAVVFVNESQTKQTGRIRTFVSPELAAGSKFQYDIRAEWTVNGKKQTANQTVTGKAGDRLIADFTK
jgi:uncharacterized protein (TIGR03000 family)